MIPLGIQTLNVHQYEGGPVNVAPSKTDRELQQSRAEEVTCPGCGGVAWAEAEPVTVWRDGKSRTVRVVTCHHTCRTKIKARGKMSAANEAGFLRTRPSRFEILITEKESSMPSVAPISPPEEREKVASAITVYGRGAKARILEAAGILQTDVDRWLRTGGGLGPSRLPRLLKWAEDVLAGNLPPAKAAPKPSQKLQRSAPDCNSPAGNCEQPPEPSLPADPPPSPVIRLEPLCVELPRPLSPADVMLEAIARRGALAELEKHGLELPEDAALSISLEWGRAGK